MTPLVSFIVVTYQRKELLQKCLESIYAQRHMDQPPELIVIDNGGDAVVPPSSNADVHLRVERPRENLGAVGGRNLGMKLAQGEFWLLLDDDAVWHDEHDASRLIALLRSDPTIGAVAVRSLAPDGSPIQAEAVHPNKEFISRQAQFVEVPYFYSMGVAIRAEAGRKAGYFPERFGIYMEEVDLSYRILDAGYRILYAPEVAVHHFRSDLGRPVRGHNYWTQSALNKSRMAWRLLPMPYPLTILIVWSMVVLVKTRRVDRVWQVWRDLWHERDLLARERHPLHPWTLGYLRRVGARLLY